ncbi:AAA family ATPase [Ferruginibacter sp. SUN106]|uniref:AAA family ATPase n=1 Tax=Ferruginibacter sp. SUN106 TaxID=2978348 RepID=UPI003D35D120
MSLQAVTIKGYKSIKKESISLKKMNVLIGQNGAGKTNFISLFKFLRNIIEGRLKNVSTKIGAENILYYGGKTTETITISLDFEPNVYEIELQPTNNDSLFIKLEHCGFWNKRYPSPYWETVAVSETESKLSESAKSHRISQYVYDELKNWRVYHFHDTSESAGVKKYASISDSKFLFEDASNLASFLFILKNTEQDYYDRIVKTIQLVIPFFKDFILEPNPLNKENIRIEWNDIYSDKTFTANEFSDGSLRFICMATLLLQKKLPAVILLDEPELGLHPSAITILAGLLKKASKRSQVIVSTQSVSLVNEFDSNDIIVVEKDEAKTVFKRLDPEILESWLNDYSLGELWDKNIIGGKP